MSRGREERRAIQGALCGHQSPRRLEPPRECGTPSEQPRPRGRKRLQQALPLHRSAPAARILRGLQAAWKPKRLLWSLHYTPVVKAAGDAPTPPHPAPRRPDPPTSRGNAVLGPRAGPGVGVSSWTPDEFRARTHGREKEKPASERASVPRTRPEVQGEVGRPGGCGSGRPFTRAGSRPRESRWNPRQPISGPRCGCACAHPPPGGAVWLRRDPAEPQLRPACLRPASGSICCRESLVHTTNAWKSENSSSRARDP